MLPREQRAALLCFSDCSSPSSLGGRDQGEGESRLQTREKLGPGPGSAGRVPWGTPLSTSAPQLSPSDKWGRRGSYLWMLCRWREGLLPAQRLT